VRRSASSSDNSLDGEFCIVITPLSLDGYPYRISFLGRVHPKGTVISIRVKRSVDVIDTYGRFTARIFTFVDNSRVTIDCFFDNLFDNYRSELFTYAMNCVRPHVDLVSFSNFVGTIVVIDKVIDIDNRTTLLAHFYPQMSGLCSSFSSTSNWESVLIFAMESPTLKLALHDLILALTIPDQLAINCARSVEGVRTLISGPRIKGKSSKEWGQMNDALNLLESYTQYITQRSQSHRHADRTLIVREEQEEILRRSWTIMDRYLNYRLSNCQRLDQVKFPVLS
jgi:hypothetical protein